MQEITFEACRHDEETNFMEEATCRNKSFIGFNCFLGFFLLFICEPLILLPYLLRSIRLYWIFKAQDYYFKNKHKPTKWFKLIREQYLIKITMIIMTVLIVATVIPFSATSYLRKVFPSYNIETCMVGDLGKRKTTEN